MTTADRSPARRTCELRNWRKCRAARLIPRSSGFDRRRAGHGGHTVVLYGCFRRFLKKRSVPARLRSRAMRVIEALSGALMPNFLGRPGGRRVRLNAFRSSGRMAHTVPTLIPYSRCLVSSRRTYASDESSSVAASATESRRGRWIWGY